MVQAAITNKLSNAAVEQVNTQIPAHHPTRVRLPLALGRHRSRDALTRRPLPTPTGAVTSPTVPAGDSFQGVLYSPGFFEFVARLTAQWVGRETAQPPSPEQVKQRPAQLQIGCRIPRAAAGDPSGPS
jgi:hypothetical protein